MAVVRGVDVGGAVTGVVVAGACVLGGDVVVGEPFDTVRLTAVPLFACAPGAGSWPMTVSAGARELNCLVIRPTILATARS